MLILHKVRQDFYDRPPHNFRVAQHGDRYVEDVERHYVVNRDERDRRWRLLRIV